MQRVIAFLVVALAAWLGLLHPAGSASDPSAVVAYTYAYDSHHRAAELTFTTTERGPPSCDAGNAHDAVDFWSHVPSARQDGPIPSADIAYSGPAVLVQNAQAMGTTRERAQVSDGPSVNFKHGRVAANGVPPRFITTGAGTTIDRLAVNTTISAQRQGRHVLGARQYGGGSYFNSADDAQRVLDDFHSGAAQVLGTKGNDIVVRVPGVTGTNVNPGAGFSSQATNVFFIKGSSSPSVVPYNPAWKP